MVRHLIAATDVQVVNVDALTYAGDLRRLEQIASSPRHRHVALDICDGAAMAALLAQERPAAIIHLAAETHVDRSIDGPAAFVRTNVTGTATLLQAALDYWRGLDAADQASFRFLHVSTDEVFGSLGAEGTFDENSPYRPNSPYSASKAAADHFVRAWHHTYGLPTIIGNCSNNYGPFQYPEKLIPLMALNAMAGRPLPVYGRGDNVRDWLHVDDHARALWLMATRGKPGGAYVVGGNAERSNIEVVRAICAVLDELAPRPDRRPHADAIQFVADRPGHDHRYAINAATIGRELGFAPQVPFQQGLRQTVEWYFARRDWWLPLVADGQATARRGLVAG
ncbi:MAG TPA: dTDP-glucose 4,6-dehydratase [Magnetospirillum sp.]|nr:dTDP-glucose 4,6-dehydratase [Magnetospirillum sp.]